MTDTPLDIAHRAMSAAPDEDGPRLAFYACLADGMLCMMLAKEAGNSVIEPRLFDLDEGDFVLVFDTEERLADFAAGVTPYASLSGRQIVRFLKGRGIGLCLNLGTGTSEMMLPAEAVDWLAETLDHHPETAEAQPTAFEAPGAVPEDLLAALDQRLGRAAGLAQRAYLTMAVYADGSRGQLLCIIGAEAGAGPALAQTVAEALTFSGLEAGALDVTFLPENTALAARLDRVALRFDLPERESAPDAIPGAAPGMDPNKPPRLR